MADGSGIDAARRRLQLADDLDGADLGRAGDRAAGEEGAQLLVHGEPGLEPRILARRAASWRGALHRARRHVFPLAAEEQLGRQRQHIELARMDERAVGHALLAPQRGIERDRVALEGEVIFQREVDLIDVASGDVVLNGAEGAVILLARPGELEVGDLGAFARTVFIEPRTGAGIVERTGRPEEPDPEQRHAAVSRKQSPELWLEAI